MRKEQREEAMGKLSGFVKGIIFGVVVSAVVFGAIAGIWFLRDRDRGLIEYAERQEAIEVLREDYVNRDPYEFLETVPDVRGAVDGAAAEFIRRRDEALQRLRNRNTY